MSPIGQRDEGLKDNLLMVFVEREEQPVVNTRQMFGNHRLLSKLSLSRKSWTHIACSFPVISYTAFASALTLVASIE